MNFIFKNGCFRKLKKYLFVIAVFMPFFSFAQPPNQGTIDYLIANNGFSDIQLGSNISTIPLSKVEYLDKDSRIDADSCYKYVYNDISKLKVSEDLMLDLIGFRTYKNKIINIYVFFRRADGYKVLREFIKNYGVFTSKPNDYMDIYDWKSDAVNLSLRYELKLDLGVAIFTYNQAHDKLASR
jgi:hypothetical protein